MPRVRRVFMVVLAVFLIGFGLFTTARANATPVEDYAAENAGRVCATLDEYPTFDGLMGIGQAIVDETGFSYFDAGQIVGAAIYTTCPEYVPLMLDFVESVQAGEKPKSIGWV